MEPRAANFLERGVKKLTRMIISVFGGGGFIGTHLCERLLDSGHELHVVDVDFDKLGDLTTHHELTAHELDITRDDSDDQVADIVSCTDLVIDLIAYANPQQYVDMPIDVVDLNLFENLNIVEHCIDADVPLIQFSTSEVYGKMGGREDPVFREYESDLTLGPVGKQRWIYSCAKQLLERMVYAYGNRGDLEYTIVRPFNFIGPKMDYIIEEPDEGTPRVFAGFMSALLYDHPMVLVNGGTNQRVFTHIEDAVDAIELIIENEDRQFTNEIVNVGAPRNETSMRELAELMRDIYRERSPEGSIPPVQA